MSFEELIQKVKQAEDALEVSERRTSARWKELKLVWKEGWTPGRIVIAGLASGFLVGRSKPLRIASGGGVLNLITALSGLMASGSAHVAAEEAGQAADAAIASAPDVAVSQVVAAPAMRPLEPFDV
ncbi:MAG: protein sip-5 [Thermomonas sp.]